MWHRECNWKLMIFSLLAIVPALLVACEGGISQSEYDALQQRLTGQEQKAVALQQQLSAKEKEATDTQQKLAAIEKEGGAAGVTTLIGAKKVPPAPPAPVPTPLPAGATPPPAPAPPASLYEPVGPFAFYVETLATTRPSKYDIVSTVACTNNSVFKRGMKIVWRFEVIDTTTGKRVTDKDEATVNVKLPHGEELVARFSQRGGGSVPDAPWMWGANWDIPLDYPIGSLDYTITVTSKNGRTGTFKQPAMVAKDRGLDTRVKIVE
ncbi:MAG: hypothetical protein HY326_03105 [Chloroflexi bacterium]|nr:hypothetical protein [Chloroflexota bacterium]